MATIFVEKEGTVDQSEAHLSTGVICRVRITYSDFSLSVVASSFAEAKVFCNLLTY